MPSAANAKSEKPASAEAADNSPIRQIMTIIEHKIRNLEKRKSKLTSYRDLQKAGKELKSDQKVAMAKFDEVAQTLEFARDLNKQITAVVTLAEREAKKQAKKDAWVRYAAETSKIREVLLILDCLVQMGNTEARDHFLNGTNGAAKLTEEDLKILDDLYPEVTPKHEVNEEGQPGFPVFTTKAAEHLYAIIEGKPKEILGTTYTHIKEIVTVVHECGYFDKVASDLVPETEEVAALPEEPLEAAPVEPEPELVSAYAPPGPVPAGLPVPPAPAVVPTPAYPLRPLPPITLQEVEHAYFAQQYPQQRPISEVIGSQNFFFLQESEIDSPIGTPQPPLIISQASPPVPAPIPSQTFTNQHFVQLPGARVPDPASIPLPPQPHFPPHPDHTAFTPLPAPPHLPPQSLPPLVQLPAETQEHEAQPLAPAPVDGKNDDEWQDSRSPDDGDRKTHGQGDGQNRFRRYGARSRGASNGYRGRGGAFQSRQGGDYHGRHERGEYQSRAAKDGYQSRQYGDGFASRHGKDGYQSRSGNDAYYGNGDAAEPHQENGGRDRYNDNNQSGFQGGFKSRSRGGARGAGGGQRGALRPPRSHQYNRKSDNAE